MLKTELNTPTMGARALRAFKKWYRANHVSGGTARLDVFFEHGQWWAQNLHDGAQWSVDDAEGSEASGVFNGFCFEQVTRGEDE